MEGVLEGLACVFRYFVLGINVFLVCSQGIFGCGGVLGMVGTRDGGEGWRGRSIWVCFLFCVFDVE